MASARRLCHALLERLTDQGVPEAVNSLTDMVEFHDVPKGPPTPELVMERFPFVISRTEIAPVYPLPED